MILPFKKYSDYDIFIIFLQQILNIKSLFAVIGEQKNNFSGEFK